MPIEEEVEEEEEEILHIKLKPKNLKYSRIPLIWHPWDWTGARISNILEYQTVHGVTKDLTGNYLLLLLCFGCTTNQRCIPFGNLLQWLAL